MKKLLIKFAPVLGGAFIILSGFLPWAKVMQEMMGPGSPFLWENPSFPVEQLAVFGTAFLGVSAILLGFGMALTRGILHAVFSVLAFLVGVFGFLFYCWWWYSIVGTHCYYASHREFTVTAGISDVHIGVYVGLAGSLIILAGLLLPRFWRRT